MWRAGDWALARESLCQCPEYLEGAEESEEIEWRLCAYVKFDAIFHVSWTHRPRLDRIRYIEAQSAAGRSPAAELVKMRDPGVRHIGSAPLSLSLSS